MEKTMFVHKDDLAMEGLENELRILLSNKWVIGDYVNVGSCFNEAASNLGFKTVRDDGYTRVVTDPDVYEEFERAIKAAWTKYHKNGYVSIDTFAKRKVEEISTYRNYITKRINDILVSDYGDTKLMGKWSMDIELYDILKDGFTDGVFKAKQAKDFEKVINEFMIDNEPLKTSLQWIIDGMTKAGYSSKFLTTPDPSIKLSILVD